ncbi:transposase [Thermodesulfobacteriota bacterium]
MDAMVVRGKETIWLGDFGLCSDLKPYSLDRLRQGWRRNDSKINSAFAGRTGQEYNQRKKRKGAFWEDRYHATAVETGEHLLRCLVYVDLNMVRSGAVSHPEQWSHGGYNEIQRPRRKNILIDYETPGHLSGFSNFEDFQSAHRRWVQSALSDDKVKREDRWTLSIATGSRFFVEAVKMQMCSFATGCRVRKNAEGFELRESRLPYNAFFDAKKSDMGGENLLFWHE